MDMVGEGQPGNIDLTQPPPGSMEEGGNMIQSLAPPVNNLPPPTSLMPGQPGGPPPPLPGMSLSGMMPLLPGMNLPPGGIVVAGGASQFPGMPGVLPGAQGQPPLPVTPGGPPPNMPHLIPGTTIFPRGLAPMITGPGAPPMQMSNMLPGQQPPLLQGQPGQPFEPLEMKSNMTRPLGMHLQAISSAGLTITSPSMIRAGLRPPPFGGQLQSPIATSTAPGFVPRLAGGLLGRGIDMSAPNSPPPTMGGGPTPLMSTDSGLLSPGAGPTGNRPLLGQSPNVSRFSTPGTAKKSLSELLNEWSTKNVHNDMEDNQDCDDSYIAQHLSDFIYSLHVFYAYLLNFLPPSP